MSCCSCTTGTCERCSCVISGKQCTAKCHIRDCKNRTKIIFRTKDIRGFLEPQKDNQKKTEIRLSNTENATNSRTLETPASATVPTNGTERRPKRRRSQRSSQNSQASQEQTKAKTARMRKTADAASACALQPEEDNQHDIQQQLSESNSYDVETSQKLLQPHDKDTPSKCIESADSNPTTQDIIKRLDEALGPRDASDTLSNEETDELMTQAFGQPMVRQCTSYHLPLLLNDTDTPLAPLYSRVVRFCKTARWNVPRGKIGAETVNLFADELNLLCNSLEDSRNTLRSERYILCRMVILQPTKGIWSGADIASRIQDRIKRWRNGELRVLAEEAICAETELIKFYQRPQNAESSLQKYRARRFSKLVSEGRLSEAQRLATQDHKVELKDPKERYTKSDGLQTSISKTIREQNPQAHGFNRKLAEDFKKALKENTLPPLPEVIITVHELESSAKKLHGGAGLSGINSNSFVTMLLVHGESSKKYRNALVRYAKIRANKLTEFHKLEALFAGRGIALFYPESQKVRSIVIGEVEERLIRKLLNALSQNEAKIQNGSIQVCCGAKGGADASVHAIESLMSFDEEVFSSPEIEFDNERQEYVEIHEPNNSNATLLLDAKNAFPNLERCNALSQVRQYWPKAARAIWASHRGPVATLWRSNDPNQSFWTYAEEGTQQGCPMASTIYSLGTLPLVKSLKSIDEQIELEQKEEPHVPINSNNHELEDEEAEENFCATEKQDLHEAIKKQIRNQNPVPSAYADDIRISGQIEQCIKAYEIIDKNGPAYGVFPSEQKSQLVVKPEQLEDAKKIVNSSKYSKIPIVTNARNLGSFLGTKRDKDSYALEKAKEWGRQIEALAKIAPNDPQGIYTVFTSSLKAKWTYQQRVLKTDKPEIIYKPIEEAIQKSLIPAITGWETITQKEREMLALPVREGGMAIDDPTKSADRNYKASYLSTLKLQKYIIDRKTMNAEDFVSHEQHMGKVISKLKSVKREKDSDAYKNIIKKKRGDEEDLKEETKLALIRAKDFETGAWLSVKPSAADHTRLSRDEFYDMTSLRYNQPLSKAKERCDYHKKELYTLHHALTCSAGGNRIHRHRTIQNCLQAIAQKALGKTETHVEREPWIIRGKTDIYGKVIEGLRGDIGLNDFHPQKSKTIIDVQIFHPTISKSLEQEFVKNEKE